MGRIVFLFIIPGLLVLSCENPLEDRVNELENQLLEHEKQQAQNDSVSNALMVQQALIDSVLVEQRKYIDSVNTEQQEYIDSLNAVQQELIEMLISGQPIEASGDAYVRINNVQICWGSELADLRGTRVTFPAIYAEIPVVIMNPTAEEQLIGSVKNITIGGATFYLNIEAKRSFDYQAIGFWY